MDFVLLPGGEYPAFMENLGTEYFHLCLAEYGKSLRALGSNLWEFFSNLDGLHDHIKLSPRFQGQKLPSFRCGNDRDKLTLHYYTERKALVPFVGGAIKAMANLVYNVDVTVCTKASKNENSNHHILTVTSDSNNNQTLSILCANPPSLSTKVIDSKVGVVTFCKSFPFHIMVDKNLHISQLGEALMKMVAHEFIHRGLEFSTFFDIVKPEIPATFASILSRINSSFMLSTKLLNRANTTIAKVRPALSSAEMCWVTP